MSKYISYRGQKYKSVDFDNTDGEYIFKLKGILSGWDSAEKNYIMQIKSVKKSLESVLKNPEKFPLESEYREILMLYSRLKRGFTY